MNDVKGIDKNGYVNEVCCKIWIWKKKKTFHFVDINTADKEKETEVEQQTTSAWQNGKSL